MKAVIGLSLLLIAGVLIWQAIDGHAATIISAIRAKSLSTSNGGGGAGGSFGNKTPSTSNGGGGAGGSFGDASLVIT